MSQYKAKNGAVAVARKAPMVGAQVVNAASIPTPDDLPAFVQPMYAEIVADLESRGLRHYDLATIRQYCQQVAIADAAARDVFENGITVPTLDGGTKANPAVKIMRDASTQSLRIANEYGLSLSSRVRLGLALSGAGSVLESIKRDIAGLMDDDVDVADVVKARHQKVRL